MCRLCLSVITENILFSAVKKAFQLDTYTLYLLLFPFLDENLPKMCEII